MSIVQRGLRFGGGILVLFSLASYGLPAVAQTGAPNSTGVPPVVPKQPLGVEHSIIGIQFGVGQNSQEGTFMCDCGAVFNGGKGMGWSESAFFEFPFAPDLFTGIKVGLDHKYTTTTSAVNELVEVVPPDGPKIDTVMLPTNRTGNLTMTLLSFKPFIQYQVLHSNFFVQVGAGISALTSSNFTQTRTMTTSSVTLPDGTTINNLTYPDGSRSDEIQYGALSNATSVLFSGRFSAGYNFIAGRMRLAPMVTYDYPFSKVQSGENWKVASFYGSLALGFQLN